MIHFMGDRFVDASGKDVTAELVYHSRKAKVAWPVTVMHAKCHRYLDTDIIERDGPEKAEFVANDYDALYAHQADKW